MSPVGSPAAADPAAVGERASRNDLLPEKVTTESFRVVQRRRVLMLGDSTCDVGADRLGVPE
jgi:hypothetical protein